MVYLIYIYIPTQTGVYKFEKNKALRWYSYRPTEQRKKGIIGKCVALVMRRIKEESYM
jgi:hypothetical protein